MPADLRTLLDDAAGTPTTSPDFDTLARQGHRRRRRATIVRGGSGLAVLAVLAVVGSSILGDLRNPPLLLDSPPQPGAGAWEPVPEAPLDPAEGAAAIDLGDGTVLIVGGRTTRPGEGEAGTAQAARFDVAEGTWNRLPDVPFTLDQEDLNAGLVVAVPANDGTPVVWRDWTSAPLASFEAAIFDADRNAWVATGPAPLSPRLRPVVAWVDGRLLVWGGHDAETGPQWDVDGPRSPEEAMGLGDRREPVPGGAVWTPQEGWSTLAEFPLAERLDASTTIVDGRLVVWGGASAGIQVEDRQLLGDGAIYDPASDSWSVLPDAGLSPRALAEIAPDGDGFLLVNGQGEVTVTEHRSAGQEENCGQAVDDVTECASIAEFGRTYAYDDPTDGARFDLGEEAWTRLPELPEGTDGYSLGFPAETLVAVGEGVVYRWDAGDESWVETPSGVADRGDTWLEATRVGDLRLGVHVPGMGSAPSRLGGAVLLDGRWTPLAEADTPARINPAVTAVGDDALLVWGGTSRNAGEDLNDYARAFTGHRDGAIWRP